MFHRTLRYLAILCALAATAWAATGAPAVVVQAEPNVPRPAAGQGGANRAALVVRFSDDNVVKRCVSFDASTISGEELLRLSGLEAVLSPQGAVCSITGRGCPPNDCFCQCPFPNCEYWAYYHWQDGVWRYADVGAAWHSVTDGALEGWSWGQGNFASGVEPPPASFEEICPALVTPTVTPTATSTVTPTIMPTQTPTVTPASTQAILPQASLQASATAVAPGVCTVLSWQTRDAESVTLDGAPVVGQDQREVCPGDTQSFVLVASNAAGHVSREVVVQVLATTATPTLSPMPAFAPTSAPTQASIVLEVTVARPTAVVQPAATISPTLDLLPGSAPVVYAQEAPMTSLKPQPTATAQLLSPLPALAFLAPPATATPRPRRALGADGRPTPTPMLAARTKSVHAAPAGAQMATSLDEQSGPPALAVTSRDFSPSLLVGYGFYLLIAAGLVGVGTWVVRRKGRMLPSAVEGAQ